jgi:hypothetical protein
MEGQWSLPTMRLFQNPVAADVSPLKLSEEWSGLTSAATVLRESPLKRLFFSLCALGLLAGCVTTSPKLNQLTPAEKQAGWTLLFDGESLAGWTPRDPARWDVVDGAIAYRAGSGPGFLCTTRCYDHFELKVDFWVDDVANSGVFLRCPAAGPIAGTNAYEVNISDSHLKWPTGSINHVARREGDVHSIGRWSNYHITAQGDHLVVRFDGRVVLDIQNNREKFGPIGLQQFDGRGMVKFRNLKLKPLTP